MRIAIVGTHIVGKSTLVEALAAALPGYAAVDEPYVQLVEEGHAFAEMPSIDDFELQLQRSIECIDDSPADAILDRCPVDLLAYCMAHPDAGERDPDEWLEPARAAAERLDLIVYVPIEEPDRVAVPSSDDGELRREVDERVRMLLVENVLGLEVDVVEATGSVRERVARVLDHVGHRRG